MNLTLSVSKFKDKGTWYGILSWSGGAGSVGAASAAIRRQAQVRQAASRHFPGKLKNEVTESVMSPPKYTTSCVERFLEYVKIDTQSREGFVHPYVVENASEAIKRAGLKPRVEPIRGGTDLGLRRNKIQFGRMSVNAAQVSQEALRPAVSHESTHTASACLAVFLFPGKDPSRGDFFVPPGTGSRQWGPCSAR
jgi:hypothetical protein